MAETEVEKAKAAKAKAAATKKADLERKKQERAAVAEKKRLEKEKAKQDRADALVAKKAERDAEKVRRAEERASFVPKAKLTNSQRRAVCALADAGSGGVTPATEMATTPFKYLASEAVGYASGPDAKGKFKITAKGKERATEINIEKYALPPKEEKAAIGG